MSYSLPGAGWIMRLEKGRNRAGTGQEEGRKRAEHGQEQGRWPRPRCRPFSAPVLPFFCLVSALFLPLLPLSAHAQEFIPPRDTSVDTTASRVRLGIFGFGMRLGADFTGRNQAILSPALDAGDLFSDRVRIRPSAEVGMGDSATTYVVNLELMYRFTPDREVAVPYVAFGGGVYSQERCGAAPDCPRVWAQFALGFELKFREHINWLLEYHGEDGLRRHRFFIGLTTRRGG